MDTRHLTGISFAVAIVFHSLWRLLRDPGRVLAKNFLGNSESLCQSVSGIFSNNMITLPREDHPKTVIEEKFTLNTVSRPNALDQQVWPPVDKLFLIWLD